MIVILNFMTMVAWLCLRYGRAENITSKSSSCPDGYFLCRNTTSICIHQTNNCNGHIDCPMGEDEDSCDDFLDSLYWDSMFRKRPSAENDHQDNACKLNYNGNCICRHRDLLCHQKNYTRVPDNIPKEPIHLLDLTGNYFPNLNPTTLENIPYDVIKLVLKQCHVATLSDGVFYDLSKLKKLYLDNNRLRHVTSGLFGARNQLEVLVLGYNSIESIDPQAFQHLEALIELDLSHNKLTHINKEIFEPLTNLTELSLRGNLLESVQLDSFPNVPLMILSLMENRIGEVKARSFAGLPTLLHLYLSHNRISYLRNDTFYNLSNLLSLTLNDNKLTHIDTGVFSDVTTLRSLNFERNPFTVLSREVLKPLNDLQHVYFERFEKCIAAPYVRVCYPKGDGISSYEHLLHNPVLRTSVWVMATVGCVGNIVVLLGRLLVPTNNVVHSLYIKNLAFSDLLMGIYLFAIAGADQHYRGVYLQHEYVWRHSALCEMCGFLSTLSCESSVLILSLVTWDRFISVTQPLARKQPSKKTASLTLLLLWIIASLVAAIPTLDFTRGYFKDFYNNNGVCLALHIHDPFQEGWEYSVIMFVFVNTFALIFICYAYARMVHEIRASSVACRSTQLTRDRDKVAQRFGIIVLTDCLCWVPVIIVKIAALLGAHISQYLYAWLAIFVLPINSALNPVLYTLTTKLFKKQMRKTINSCIPKRKRPGQSHGSDSAYSLSFGMFPLGGGSRRGLTYRVRSTSSLRLKCSRCSSKCFNKCSLYSPPNGFHPKQGTQSSLATATSKENSSKKPTAV